MIKSINSWIISKAFWIDPNIKELKSKIGKNKVLTQYFPPEWLSPSEVWMIYNRSYKSSNINCMVYKWANEWVVSLKDEWERLKLKFLKSLKESTPKYELSYWNMLINIKRTYKVNALWMRYHELNDNNDFVFRKWFIPFQDELLDFCVEKWWLKKSSRSLTFFDNLIILCCIIPYILMYFINSPLYYFIVIVLSIVIWSFFCLRKDEINCKWNIELTDEWEKIFAEIYWYKYFLEHCEEERLRKFIEEDPDFINKTLPYAVALRLDNDLLKYSLSCFSTGQFDIDVSELKLDD